MEKIFKVTGMHCSSCEMLVKDSLEENGARVIEISHKTGIIKVEFDEKKINESKIKSIIQHEGYKVV